MEIPPKLLEKTTKAPTGPSRIVTVAPTPVVAPPIEFDTVQQAAGNLAIQRLFDSAQRRPHLSIVRPDVPYAEPPRPIADRLARAEPESDSGTSLPSREPASVAGREVLPPTVREGEPSQVAPSQRATVSQARKDREPPADKGTPGVIAAGGAAVGRKPRAPAASDTDPDFQRAKAHIRVEAARQKEHDPVGTARKRREEAQRASFMMPARDQQEQSAKEKTTEKMEEVAAEQERAARRFDRKKFKEDLLTRVGIRAPKTEDELETFSQEPFEKDFAGSMAQEQGKVTGPLKTRATDAPSVSGDPGTDAQQIPTPIYPPGPRPVDPKLVTPKPKTDQEISLQHESDRLDDAMQQHRLSDEQLAGSREPSFLGALKAKQSAEQKIAEAHGMYRRQEAAILEGTQAQVATSLPARLGRITKVRHRVGGDIFDRQGDTASETVKRQRDIKEKIDGIYGDTVRDVKNILDGMAKKVKEDFANSLSKETNDFANNVKNELSKYWSNWKKFKRFVVGEPKVVLNPDGITTRELEYPGDFEGFPLQLKAGVDWVNPNVHEIFLAERQKFIDKMDHAIDDVAASVELGLAAASLRIQLGRFAIDIFKATLRGEEREFADQLGTEVQFKFKSLETSIDAAREDLLQTLADQYSESLSQLGRTFNEINDELKQTWVDRAVDFIETVGKTIYQLAELLFSILTRVAHLVWDIIKHPIRFFETLVSGLKQGIGTFIGSIGTYLQEAFWTWITGATTVKNIRLSAASGIEGLFDLVTQVLSLGPADLRAIVEKVLGKEFMQMIDKGVEVGEKVLEPVTILLTKGPVAFWEYIKDTLGSVIQSSFDRIKESVFYAFIEKGLKWIAGFFIPGGGFVRVVKAIFSAFQFVAENLENIRHFFDSVFDSMESAIEGHTEAVANKIVTGLKTGVVLALDFLAKQLGLGQIIDGVHRIIQALRRPIVTAIEFVLGKVKPLVTKTMRTLRIGGREPEAEAGYAAPKGIYDGRIGKVVPFSASGESHRLWIIRRGTHAVVMMSSAQKPVSDYLAEYHQMAGALTDEHRRQAVIGLIAQARRILGQLDTEADTLTKDISKPKPDPRQIEREDQTVESDEERLAATLVQIREALGLPEAPSDRLAPGPEAERVADVRGRVFQALAQELRHEHTWVQIQAIVHAVGERFRPDGLRSLEVLAGNKEDEAIIYAEASKSKPLGRLKHSTIKPPFGRRAVALEAEITLAGGTPVPARLFPALGKFPSVTHGAEILPGSREVSEMGKKSYMMPVVTINTSPQALDSPDNDSHAEHQFYAALIHHEELLKRVRKIVISVHDYIPCGRCSENLLELMQKIKEIQGTERVISEAHIYWGKYFSGAIPPSASALDKLRSSGWSLHAPLEAWPPEEKGMAWEGEGLWYLAGAPLAAPATREAPPPGAEAVAAGPSRRPRGR